MKRKLGEILIERRLVTQGDIDSALSDQSAGEPNRLGDLLVALGKLAPADLARALSTQASLPFVELGAVPPDVLASIPLEVLQGLRAVPFKKVGTELHVALADPSNLEQLKELVSAGGRKVKAYVAPVDEVEAMLAQAAGHRGFEAVPGPGHGPTADELFGSLDEQPAAPSSEFDDLFQGLDGSAAPPEVRPPPPSSPARPTGVDDDILAQLAKEEAAEVDPSAMQVEDSLDPLSSITEAVVVEEEEELPVMGLPLGDEAVPELGLDAAVTLEEERPPLAPTRRMEPLTMPELALRPESTPTRVNPTLKIKPAAAPALEQAPAPSPAPATVSRPKVPAAKPSSPRVTAPATSPGSAAVGPPAPAAAPGTGSATAAPQTSPATAAEPPAPPPASTASASPATRPARPSAKASAVPAAAVPEVTLPDWLKDASATADGAVPAASGEWTGELEVVAPSKLARALARALVKKGVLTEAELLALLDKE